MMLLKDPGLDRGLDLTLFYKVKVRRLKNPFSTIAIEAMVGSISLYRGGDSCTIKASLFR